MNASAPSALVIGSGIAGLATAIRLAVKGYAVTVFEASAHPGGKLHDFQLGAWRFDAGPSLFTMPEQVTALFELAGRRPEAYFQYRRLAHTCTYYWPDGVRFVAPSDPAAFAREAATVFDVPADRIADHLTHSAHLLQTVGDIFLRKPLQAWSTWANPAVGRSLLTLRIADLLYPLDRLHRQRLAEPHLVQLFNRFATYNGSDPYRTPALMAMIAALEHGQGVFHPEGGMVAITRALHRLAEELGVIFRFEEKVTRIVVEGQQVKGVHTEQGFTPGSVVVSNMDIWYTYRQLLPEQPAPEQTLSQERSSSALVFYWGMDQVWPELSLHNIFFSGDYAAEFRQLFQGGGECFPDPTVYVNISSKESPEDAPAGGENWFVMVNAPRHEGQDWSAIQAAVRTSVLAKLESLLGRPVAPHIREEKIWTPRGIEADTLSYQGALYGNSSNNRFAAFLRHPNANRRVRGLFHSGGTVHPGGGIPLCLLSAAIAAEQVPLPDQLHHKTN